MNETEKESAPLPVRLERRVGGCEPIETAPKDGTPIILLYFDAGRVCWVRDGKFVSPIGWYSINGTGGLHPTHWMPLPESPNGGVKAAAEGSPATERSEP